MPTWMVDKNAVELLFKASAEPAPHLPSLASFCRRASRDEITALLRRAREIGCAVQPGRPVMDYQVRGMSEFFGIERKGGAHG